MSESLIETIIRVNNQTVGRDRLIRLLQYGSKLFWWLVENTSDNRNLTTKFKNLEYSLSTARKLLRLGRFLDVMYSSLKTMHLNDVTLRVSITMGKISQALYLLTDHIIWFDRMSLININKTKWTTTSNKFWLLSIICFLLRNLHELHLAMKADRLMLRPREKNEIATYVGRLRHCVQKHPDVAIDVVKNSCDLLIPLTSLGYVRLSPGFVGLMGVISSLGGLMTIINPVLKLQPS